MGDLDDPDGQFMILYGIDDPVFPLADAVAFLGGELLAPRRTGLIGQGGDPLHDPPQVFAGDGSDVLPD